MLVSDRDHISSQAQRGAGGSLGSSPRGRAVQPPAAERSAPDKLRVHHRQRHHARVCDARSGHDGHGAPDAEGRRVVREDDALQQDVREHVPGSVAARPEGPFEAVGVVEHGQGRCAREKGGGDRS